MTPVEVWSAVCRLRREGLLDSPGVRTARRRLRALVDRWIEIDYLHAVRQRAQRLLETHPLRAADSLQLAAALVLVADQPDRFAFVTLDERLAEAAEREGFDVVGVTPG
jgi:predicted nucleic acid-binding protein